jgi:hypothetical protein
VKKDTQLVRNINRIYLHGVVVFSVIVITIECFCHHVDVNCQMPFYLSIANLSSDTIRVVLDDRNKQADKIDRFSNNDFIIFPNKTITDTIYYKWIGSDVCTADCSDKSYNGQMFIAHFFKSTIQIYQHDIVPCLRCDSLRNDIKRIGIDCPPELTDTLYFTGN